jgi:hypothetical protein
MFREGIIRRGITGKNEEIKLLEISGYCGCIYPAKR